MQFHVGPVLYRLVISDRSIFDESGDELEGLANEARRLLILSQRVEPERREEVALHELMHAFEFHFPAPKDAEERAQMFAIAAKAFRLDLEEQGGAEALLQLPLQRVPHLGKPAPQAAAQQSSAETWGMTDRIVCGSCGAETMCGSVSNGEASEHAATRQFRLERWVSCEICGALNTWLEVCTPDGTPLGQFVSNPPPRVLRGGAATSWLAARAVLA